MSNSELLQAVERFAVVTANLSEADLERPWGWQDYTFDGVRFSFFRVYEVLRTLAANLHAKRSVAGPPLTTAQHMLGQHQQAYRDLQAVLLDVKEFDLDYSPDEGEWPIRTTLRHIMAGELWFYAVVHAALNMMRNGETPKQLPQEQLKSTIAADYETLDETISGSLAEIWSFYAAFHTHALNEFAGITAEELASPSYYWESQPFNLQFRLHRFDAHLRQHTIQIEKTLDALGKLPTEAHRLLRHVYNALAEVDGALIGADKLGAQENESTAEVINELADEIGQITTSRRKD